VAETPGGGIVGDPDAGLIRLVPPAFTIRLFHAEQGFKTLRVVIPGLTYIELGISPDLALELGRGLMAPSLTIPKPGMPSTDQRGNHA
jgi:hypothetical protein